MYRQFNKKHERGFTLIEMILIIAILAIISFTVIARFVSYSNSVKAKICITNQKLLGKSQVQHLLDNGRYADSIESLTPYFSNGAPQCPNGGTYILHENGNISCSISDHH